MAIRCAAKAIIVKQGCILLNKCVQDDGSVYYDLPGGGQNLYESMEEAVVREVKEETGYEVEVRRCVALAEEIYTNPDLRAQFPDYTHRILHIFLAEITREERENPTEKDYQMEDSEWIPLEEVASLPRLCPDRLRERMIEVLEAENIVFLGTEYID